MTKPKRQHPLWMVFQLGETVKDLFIPIIFFAVIHYKNDALWVTIGLIGALLFMCYKVIAHFFQWKNNTYILTESHLEVNEGKFIARKRYIGLERIQSYQQQTPFLHRLFHLTSLTLLTGTTSSDDANVKLPMITESDAEIIIAQLQLSVKDGNQTEQITGREKPTIYYEMSPLEIVYFSISSLYFLAIFPILGSVYFKVEEIFQLSEFSRKVFALLTSTWIMIAIVLLFVIVIAILFGIIFTYLRHGNYKVAADEAHIYISKGILTQANFIIPRDKINGVLIERTFPRRLFGIVRVKLVTLGDLLEEDSMQTDIVFPFLHEKRMQKIMPQLLPEFQIRDEMQRVPQQAMFLNLIQPSYLLVIVTFLIFYFWPEYWFVPIAYVFFLIVYRILKTKQTKFVLHHPFIQFQSGVFSTELFITKCQKIDELVLAQSYLERKLGVSSMTITTRGKPIHIALVEHIPTKDAVTLFHWYQKHAYFCQKETNSYCND